MNNLEELFAVKQTENGDLAYKTTTNHLVDLLFMSEYYQNHLDAVQIGTSDKEKLFSMFIRDPRFGLGRRDFGRRLMKLSQVPVSYVVKAGRWDDVFVSCDFDEAADALFNAIVAGDNLAKKWAPRWVHHNKKKDKDGKKVIMPMTKYQLEKLELVHKLAARWNCDKQQYGKFIKCDTTESKLSQGRVDEIDFSKTPSLALLKYWGAFSHRDDMKERFAKWQQDVKAGKSDLKVSTTTVYDIYKNRERIDPDLVFDKIEKISGSWIPVVDSSGSMLDGNDSYGKAMAIGHYLAKTSTYCPDTVISFSSRPQLLKLGVANEVPDVWGIGCYHTQQLTETSPYKREIQSMHTGDCSNTDFGKVIELLRGLDEAPEYIVVLSDMEFDEGSNQSKDETMRLFIENGFNTKIVWWNFNSRATTCPETDKYGNIFISGYNPMLLKFLEVGFDANSFLDKLLEEYAKAITK